MRPREFRPYNIISWRVVFHQQVRRNSAEEKRSGIEETDERCRYPTQQGRFARERASLRIPRINLRSFVQSSLDCCLLLSRFLLLPAFASFSSPFVSFLLTSTSGVSRLLLRPLPSFPPHFSFFTCWRSHGSQYIIKIIFKLCH